MSTLFLSLVLIFIINLPVAMRKYVKSHSIYNKNSDYFTVIPFISVIVTVFIFLSYGFTVSILLAFLVSLTCLLLNIRDFYHFSIHLKKGADSPWGFAKSAILTLLLIGYLVVICVYCPSFIKAKPVKSVYAGDEKTGYELNQNMFAKSSLQLVEFKENKADEKVQIEVPAEELEKDQVVVSKKITKNLEEKNPSIVFVPDVYVNVTDSIGTLYFLNQRGYDVYGFNFLDDKFSYYKNGLDSRYFREACLRYESKTHSEKLEEAAEKIVNNRYLQFVKADVFMKEAGIEKYYILADGNCIEAANRFAKENPDSVIAIYNINKDDQIEGYVDGLGNLPQTRPMESAILKIKSSRKWDDAKKIAFFADKKFRGEK